MRLSSCPCKTCNMPGEAQPVTVEIGLNAVIVAVVSRSPRILAVSEADGDARDSLPFGPFDPARHRTFEASLRARVEKRTALKLGYIEQLYTFGDRGRQRLPGEEGKHMVSVGYL
ncbi:NAD regulator, partial [Sinorhizobium meliloti]